MKKRKDRKYHGSNPAEQQRLRRKDKNKKRRTNLARQNDENDNARKS
jgi:hypothetical protein